MKVLIKSTHVFSYQILTEKIISESAKFTLNLKFLNFFLQIQSILVEAMDLLCGWVTKTQMK